jgi:predicted 2-oxoglutarate/Fe(II)-dependent dioxygenase YbiX
MLNLAAIAGDTVFYNSNILHCATYNWKAERATLHACMGDAVRGGAVRARNILQHDLKWMQGAEFRNTLPNDTAKRMLDRLLVLQNEKGSGEVVYSLA